jgi:hypothetical protein
MKNAKLAIIILILVSIIFSCGDDKTVNQVNYNYDIYFEDFIHFETERFILSKQVSPFYGPSYEPIEPMYERSMGEPFIDINDNNVYDEGIDLFIMAADSTNMDLDRNSSYTPPWPHYWVSPLPFDDLDGNNEFSWRDKESSYIFGFPFCDFNENGIHDTNITYDYNMIQFTESVVSDSETIIYINKRLNEDWYRFVSDSGFVYRYPSSDPWKANAQVSFNFILRPDGIYFNDGGNYLPKILDTGKIIYMNDSLADSAFYYDFARGFYKTVVPDQNLEIDGVIYEDLLSINIISEYKGIHTDPSYLFYFDRDQGLIYLRYGNLLQNKDEVKIYFEKSYDTLPLPMTRWYGD